MKESEKTQRKNEIAFLVSKNEFRLLRAALLLELEQEVFLKRAQVENSRYRLKFSFKQFTGFLTCLTDMVWFLNKERDKKRLGRLINKLTRYLSLTLLVQQGNPVTPPRRWVGCA